MMKSLTKKCGNCKKVLPLTPEFFHRSKDKRDGFVTMCKACKRAYGYEYRVRRGMKKREISKNLPREEWRPVIGYEGWYEISNFGRVKRIGIAKGAFVGMILKPAKHPQGYLFFRLTVNSKPKAFRAHCLVAGAFIGPCPEGMEVNHKDGIKDNNHVENLEYLTPSENQKHAFRLGLKSNKGENGPHILTEADIPQIRRLLAEGELTQREIGNKYGVATSTINNIKRGTSWGWLK